MKTPKRISFIYNNTLQVFNFAKTSNGKIGKGVKLMQSYTYSFEQFELASKYGKKTPHADFIALDKANCMDCPFSINSGNGGCYTHDYHPVSGELSQLASIANEFGSIDNIQTFNTEHLNAIVSNAKNQYVRFGAYGEPSLHPIELVKAVAESASSWTGYTHQWFRFPQFRDYFMASVHTEQMAKTAAKKGFRSFVVVDNINEIDNFVKCPASKEMGKKTSCADCGLCSGVMGKGKKSIAIQEH